MATKAVKSDSSLEVNSKPINVNFAAGFQNRSSGSSKDRRLLNCFIETNKDLAFETKKHFLISRPGMSLRRSYTAGTARGAFRWNSADYIAIGNTVFKDGTSHQTITGTSGRVGFAIVNDAETEKLFFCDGTNGFVTDGTTSTQVPQSLSDWTADTITAVGNRRVPVTKNGFYYEAIFVTGDTKTHATTEPVWPTVIGDQIVDDLVTWACHGYYGLAYATWSTPRTPVVNAQIVPTISNGYFYECTVSGAVGATEPSWPVTIGNSVVDGGATWLCTGLVDTTNPMPKSHVPFPVFLDGSLYLIAKNTDGSNSASIYNSDTNNPFSWNQVDFVDAEHYPDRIGALVRHHNYIVAFGTESLEFFSDTANATGSPLTRNESFLVKIGCPAAETVQQIEKTVLFLGQSSFGGYGVWAIENYAPRKISDEYIDRIITAEGSSISTAKAFTAQIEGHTFYILRLSTRTLVFDLEERMWGEWTSNSGGSHVIFVGSYSFDIGNGTVAVLGNTDGKLYALDAAVFQDNSVAILMDIVTSKFDFETQRRKFLHKFSILSDDVASTTLSICWSDNDYSSWSTPVTLALDNDPKSLHRLGEFRRRAFNITYSGNAKLRLESMDFVLSLGSH